MGFGSLGENPKTIGGIGRAGAISGIKEIDRALAKLEKKFNKKVMKKAMQNQSSQHGRPRFGRWNTTGIPHIQACTGKRTTKD
jgi:hypothetical protein